MNAFFSDDLVARLDRLVARGGLPGKARDYGEALLQRLRAPVRVVVAGPARSGKSTLIALLAGSAAPASEGPGGPGPVASSVIENLVLIEHAGAEAPLAHCAPHIILWCTQGFAKDEAATWAEVPDGLKDHAFLVLTKADELIRVGILQERLDDLCDVVESEFHSLFPIATRQALSAWSGTQIVDEVAHARSGARALFDALERMVAQGRRADLDAGELFLRRHDGLTAHPVPAAPQAAPRPEAAADSSPDHAPGTSQPPAAATNRAAAAVPAPDVDVSQRALRLLDTFRDGFPGAIEGEAADAVSDLLSLCGNAAEALNALVSDLSGVSEELSEDVLEANETMILLALEGTASAAADAVTLLLQLRRGFETRLAA
ncbi:hypothetical protein SAMN05444722_1935 [Rhodovulum sp. ES.010]|uniref:hypothetical protein n=1 Tax=Rhodovulum sp. ES.010 TaxID=1882821 RepID=UPI000925CEF3|nr:hypothetical protein [Rhodovulum sp. ES.010]SIO40604.1 hypothetical protein SAMN05444722_1935 [Rhodovulum sp. ES.010]